MRKDTKLYKVLKYLYLNMERSISSNELADKTGIPRKQVTPYTNRLSWHVTKTKKNGLYHYQLKSYDAKHIKNLLQNAI